MKKIINFIFSIEEGHFLGCPSLTLRAYTVEKETRCRCRGRSYGRALSIGVSMFIMECAGGLMFNSLSLLGDSFHLAADSLALALGGFLAPWLIQKFENKKKLILKMAVLVIGSTLILSSVYLLFESFCKFLHPCQAIGLPMMIIATIGILGNFLQHQVLTSIGPKARKEDLVRSSIILHIFSDLMQSFAVVAGGLAIIFVSSASVSLIIDPFLSTCIGSVMIVYAIRLISKAFSKDEGHDHGHLHVHH